MKKKMLYTALLALCTVKPVSANCHMKPDIDFSSTQTSLSSLRDIVRMLSPFEWLGALGARTIVGESCGELWETSQSQAIKDLDAERSVEAAAAQDTSSAASDGIPR